MLKKLRNRIVLTNLLLVGVLLVAVSAGLCIYIANDANKTLKTRLDSVLRFVLETPNGDPNAFFGFPGLRDNGSDGEGSSEIKPESPDLPETPEGIRKNSVRNNGTVDGAAFAVLLDSDGNVILKRGFFASMDEDSLSYAIGKVEESGKNSGYIKDLDLVFAKRETQKGTAVAFTPREEAAKTVRSSIIIAVCVDVVVMVFIALISFRLASLSMKPVQEAWDSQKRFIGDASHELKTPLTVILANNSILESGVTDPEQRQWLESNRYEAERMQKLIEEMLFLAKSDEGGYRMNLGPVNVSEIAEYCCLTFETVAFDQKVEIETDIEPDVMMTTDSSMLEKVLGVLMDNAVKHSPEGGTVRFRLASDAKSVRISVNNGGDIIAEEDLSHVFERFYKADASRTADSAKSGFGLGLSIAHDIVLKLDGTIGVKSSAVEGTTFTVTLKKT